MTGKLTDYWDKRDADDFDKIATLSGRTKAIEKMAKIAVPYLQGANTASIELGCGTGLFAELANARNIIGVDFSASLLAKAKNRMDTVWQKSIFDLDIAACSFDNVISMFVIDDYPADKKRDFFSRVAACLKPGGHFFFAAYSPNDEGMGILRNTSEPPDNHYEVYLESDSFYKILLDNCSCTATHVEIFRTQGKFKVETQLRDIWREYILIVAVKGNVLD
jgi:SAM-dependent methyltransferase